MKSISKTLLGTAAGAMALAGATPALARDRDNGISAGEIIAGALIIGGIAAVAGAFDGDDDDRYDDRYGSRYDQRYDRRDDSGYDRSRMSGRAAVERCVQVAESEAYRYGYRRADVTDIRGVARTGDGYRVKGRIAVDAGSQRARGNGWGNDYRGSRDEQRGWDSGNFTCDIDGTRVAGLDFGGIRRLR